MMKRLAILGLSLALGGALAGCSDDAAAPIDAAPSIDVPPGQPDATPGSLYPPGPYGYEATKIIADEQYPGYVPTAPDDLVYDNDATTFNFRAFYQGNDPDAKVIMMNIGATWCVYCKDEASKIEAQLYDVYYSQGVRFMTIVAQNDSGGASAASDAKNWAQTYGNTFPTLYDPTGATSKYCDQSAFPANVFIDARTMEIKHVTTGGDTSVDMVALKNIIDYMLATE